MNDSDPAKNGRHSTFERIGYTVALDPTDQRVLLMLATFANYKTFRDARPSLQTLAARCNLHWRTVLRSLQRLEKAGYIVGQHREGQRLPTIYSICLDRLAVTFPKGSGSTTASQGSSPETTDSKDSSLDKTTARESSSDNHPTTDSEDSSQKVTTDFEDIKADQTTDFDDIGTTDSRCSGSTSTYGSSSTYDPPISTSALRAEIPTDRRTDDQNPSPAARSPNKFHNIAVEAQQHARRKRLLAKLLRTLTDQRNWRPWESFKDVELALRAFSNHHHIQVGDDYGPADFNDAIIEVNTAIPLLATDSRWRRSLGHA